MTPFQPGDTVVERGVFGNRILFARPLRVLSHDDGVLAMSLPIGTEYFGGLWDSREAAYTDFFEGKIDFGYKTWVQHHVLILLRPDDAYSVMGFWNEQLDFVGWYINLQEPADFNDRGFDTQDQALDIVIGEDLKSWMWKDEAELALCVEMGLYTAQKATAVRRAGEDVIGLLGSGNAWWGHWRSHTPDPSAPIPVFPERWDEL